MTIAENPFFVLGLLPDASRIEVEREAQKLLGMLELEFAAAQRYDTPVGPQPRTAEAVRAAVAALRDPYRRRRRAVGRTRAARSTVRARSGHGPRAPVYAGALGWNRDVLTCTRFLVSSRACIVRDRRSRPRRRGHVSYKSRVGDRRRWGRLLYRGGRRVACCSGTSGCGGSR